MLSLSEVDPDVLKHLREALSKFVLPDNTTLLQASKDLYQLSQHPSFLSSLFFILANESATEMRHTAAVVFRRKVVKLWKSIDDSNRLAIKEATLKRLQEEPDPVVRNSVMEMAGGIAKQEFAKKRPWEEVVKFVHSSVHSGNELEMERGTQVLKIICENAAGYLTEHHCGILTLIDEVLKLSKTPNTWQYAVQAFNFLVPYLGDEEGKLVRALVPKSVLVIKSMLDNNMEDKATELIELFESLIVTEVSFIAPYVKDLVGFVLYVASNMNFENETRSRVLCFLQSIIRTKKKAILKHDLLDPILQVICPLLLSPINEDEDDVSGFVGDSSDSQSPLASALHVVDDLALHLPPEKLYERMFPFVRSLASSDDDRIKRGILLTLGCLSEGTSEFIKLKHLKTFLEIVCKGVIDPNTHVSGAALFALGQFSEHLQPDINKFAPEIMPMLFGVLHQVSEIKKGSRLTKAYYALENFVENLDTDLFPYLDQLMRHLLNTLKSTSDIHTKELVVSAIGATANAAKENLLPYLPEILPLIQSCLSSINQGEDDDQAKVGLLQTQALDTLAVLVRTLGKSNIQLAEDSMKLGLELIGLDKTDPDLRRTAYGLFAAVSSVVGESMAPFLDVVVKCLMNSVKSNEGITAHFQGNGNDESKNFSFLDDSTETDIGSDDVDEDVDDDDDDNYCDIVDEISVENAYMDEKDDAIGALGDFAKHSSQCFQSYIKPCFEEIVKLNDFPHSDIRRSTITTLGQFLISSYQLKNEFFHKMLGQVFVILVGTIIEEADRLVVMTAIMTFKEVLEVCGGDTFPNQEVDLQDFMAAIVQILQQKSACQDEDVDDDDEQQAEYDEMLIEYCGEIFPILAEKLKSTFVPYFMACLPTFLSKLKPSCTVSERSFGAGTIAETVEKLGCCCPSGLLKEAVPKLMKLSRSEVTNLRPAKQFCAAHQTI
ncbi:importin-4-like isoform X2 [Clavelina lepadiformis]|uniref:importin-4-like isoform X2 n=1 Tax=Clavelina lepadiformis TaxID=159417 RepID=UPI0040419357